ncbi:hypothetical protein COHA_001023 [Chlorella ohadii]|uniref:Uncharacterized protein n=1 Tax=Chlorella ohadii TaxID=2649997 RepID=A0AAD5E031_9CHLO|nr:hypothetical protein COHA_001023 [Chlorella ohadii]
MPALGCLRALTHPATSTGPLSGSRQPLLHQQAATQRPQRPLRPTAAAGLGGGGERHERPRDTLLNALGSSERAGSEYGEGFVQFRLSGERIHLDVDSLNEQLKVQGPDRLRHSMRPDEAFGLIFQFDNVVANTRELQRAAWKAVADAEGLPFPAMERPQLYDMRPERAAMDVSGCGAYDICALAEKLLVGLRLHDMRPERAAMDVLMWTRDMKRAQELAWLVATEYAKLLMDLGEPMEGVAEWLQLMSKNRVPSALVTTMDRHTTDALLERLGLRHYFTCTVTADDDMETIAQRFLSAAIKLGRPPDHCVVFAACPTAVTAAHNCTMKAVAVMGTHPAFSLKNADLTCASLQALTVYNIRRLFANRGSEHMDLRKKTTGAPPSKRRLRNATHDDL